MRIPWGVLVTVVLAAAAASAAKPKPSVPAPPPPPNPLEKTFAQGEQAETAWSADCAVRESVEVGETRQLDLAAAKILSEEVPVVTFALERKGKIRATGVGVGLTVLRVLKKKGGQQLVCVRGVAPARPPPGFDPAEVPSPGPCVLPRSTRALLSQSVALEPGARLLLPMPAWKRFSVDAPDVVRVVGGGPDELVLEAKAAGTTQLRVCLGARVEVITLEVQAAAASGKP